MTTTHRSLRPRTVLTTLALLGFSYFGCYPSVEPGHVPSDAGPGGSDAAAMDAGSHVPDPMVDAGGMVDAGPPEVVGRGAIRDETCGNEIDDDDNGIIDDGCDCAVGTQRPCWIGPPDARGIGVCRDGVQHCTSDGTHATWAFCEEQTMPKVEILENGLDDDCDGTIDEPDGICVPTLNDEVGTACANGRDDDCDTVSDCDDPGCEGIAHCPGGCESNETLCWGGVDDDCDGDFDCDDSDCASEPSCATGPCPAGQTPTYRERILGSSWAPSNISRGDGRPIMTMTCESGSCPSGQVSVVRQGVRAICVPPPFSCPAGTDPNYVGSTWRCDGPCTYVVHYGSIYGGQNVCAPPPSYTCGSGQVPTFVYETRRWECRPICDNGLYDRINLDGRIVCVPC